MPDFHKGRQGRELEPTCRRESVLTGERYGNLSNQDRLPQESHTSLGFSLVPLIAASFLPMKASSASPVPRTLLGGHFAPSSEMRRTVSRRPSCHSNAQGWCAIMCCLIFGCTTFHQKAHNVKMAMCICNAQGCQTLVLSFIFCCSSLHHQAHSVKMAIGSCCPQRGLHQRVLFDLWLHHFPLESTKYRDGHWRLQPTSVLYHLPLLDQ